MQFAFAQHAFDDHFGSMFILCQHNLTIAEQDFVLLAGAFLNIYNVCRVDMINFIVCVFYLYHNSLSLNGAAVPLSLHKNGKSALPLN